MSTEHYFKRAREGAPLVQIKYFAMVVVGVVGTLYHLWYAWTYGFAITLHMIVHLGMLSALTTISLFDPHFRESQSLVTKVDNAVILPAEFLTSVGLTYYLATSHERLAFESLGIYSSTDVLIGGLLILLVLDLCRRTYGIILSGIAVIGLIYAFYGQYFPGILQHQGVSLERLITANTVELSGIFGQILNVGSTFIAMFIIFAGFLEAYGALGYFMELGSRIGQRIRSGVTQTAVIASLGMASVNGSAAANSATTGAFTIPLMKKEGIKSESAAAIESVASSGGQVMPPIMGAAAFIMAEITGTSYLAIIKIGLLPALLFYATIVVAVHLLTIKEGAGLSDFDSEAITGRADDSQDDGRKTADEIAVGTTDTGIASSLRLEDGAPAWKRLLRGSFLIFPVGVLIYTLVFLQYGALLAGLYSIAATLPATLIQRIVITDDGIKSTLAGFGLDTLDACRMGIENTAAITMALAVMGLFVGILNLTGFTQAFASTVVDLSGGSLVLLLFLAMIAAILFGLGMPTVAAYIVAVLLIAPALTNLGVRLETAHFFVFYFAILSALTPPVAIAVIVTTRIANANFWKVCSKAILIGLPLFILPYVFLVNPSLLYWEFPATLFTLFVTYSGLVSISVALVNYLGGPLPWFIRGALITGSLVVLFANAYAGPYATGVQFAGSVLLIGFLLWKSDAHLSLANSVTS